MKNQILYITEHLCKMMTPEHLQCIQKCCQLSDFKLNANFTDFKAIKKIKSPSVVLATEKCLIRLLETENFVPKSNFVLFGSHKEDFQLEKYKDQIKDLRFIFGDPPLPLLETILTHTLKFFKDKSTENICTQFDQKNSISLAYELQNSKQRDEMQQKISQFFQEQIDKNKENLTTGASVYAKNLSDILEEFLMNAIWDANPKYSQVDRTKPIQLLDSEKVNINCMFDGINLVLTVTDLFGSFASSAIQKHIQFSLGIRGESNMKEGTSGAGIGLFMILQKIGVLIFEVEKGKATRATAIARGDQPLRDMQKKSRTLLFYEK